MPCDPDPTAAQRLDGCLVMLVIGYDNSHRHAGVSNCGGSSLVGIA
jgi:hypothetical protein